MSSKVAVVCCPEYSEPILSGSLGQCLELLGGWEQFVKPGEPVLVKPNFIAPRPPTIPAQTDGRLVLAIVQQLVKIGAKVQVGDSTAWGSARKNSSLAGLDYSTLQSLGVELVKFGRSFRVIIPTPAGPRRIALARAVLEADKIINVPKLKSHQQLLFSGALKNSFGAVSGKRKAWWHFAYSRPTAFADMLVGVHQKVCPALNIVDAVVIMQGQGPINGKPRQMGLLLASPDAAALDRVICELIGLSPEQSELLAAARRAGAGATDLADIELLGETLESVKVNDFVFAELHPIRFSLLRVIKSTAKQIKILLQERLEKAKAR